MEYIDGCDSALIILKITWQNMNCDKNNLILSNKGLMLNLWMNYIINRLIC